MKRRCWSMVRGERYSRAATCALVNPWATRRSTSTSGAESLGAGERGARFQRRKEGARLVQHGEGGLLLPLRPAEVGQGEVRQGALIGRGAGGGEGQGLVEM